jgi:hypothetical protein
MSESRGFSAINGMRHPAHHAPSATKAPYLVAQRAQHDPAPHYHHHAAPWPAAESAAPYYGAEEYAAHGYPDDCYEQPHFHDSRYQEPPLQRAAPQRFGAAQMPASAGGLRADPRRAAQAARPVTEPYYTQAQPRYPGQYPDHATAAYPAQAQPERPPKSSLSVTALMQSAGALLSVALILGSGAWVWQMMQRDVAGVPVVRALEGPLRVAPEVPGGRQAEHQGLAVTQLAGSQDPQVQGDIVLAPPPPELQMDDVPAPFATAQQAQPAQDDSQPILAALQQAVDMPGFPSEPLGINNPTVRAVALSPRPVARSGTPGPEFATAPAVAPAGALAPDDLAASVASSVAMGLSGTQEIDIDPATLGPGTRLVQLGAYDDAASARAAWDQLKQRFSPLLDDRGRVIEAAHSGGSVFYRLRAHGFSDERDARRFCAALVDQQIDCIPVLIR